MSDALSAHDEKAFLAKAAPSARTALERWWTNLALVGFDKGAVTVEQQPSRLLYPARSWTVTLAAGVAEEVGSGSTDGQYMLANTYRVTVQQNAQDGPMQVASWAAMTPAPWDEPGALIVEHELHAVVVGAAAEGGSVRAAAPSVEAASAFVQTLARQVDPSALLPGGPLVFVSADPTRLRSWFGLGDGGAHQATTTGADVEDPDRLAARLSPFSLNFSSAVVENYADNIMVAAPLSGPAVAGAVALLDMHTVIGSSYLFSSIPQWAATGFATYVQTLCLSNADAVEPSYPDTWLETRLRALSRPTAPALRRVMRSSTEQTAPTGAMWRRAPSRTSPADMASETPWTRASTTTSPRPPRSRPRRAWSAPHRSATSPATSRISTSRTTTIRPLRSRPGGAPGRATASRRAGRPERGRLRAIARRYRPCVSLSSGSYAPRTRRGSWRPPIALAVIVVLLSAWLGDRLGTEEAGRFVPSTTGLTEMWGHDGSQSAYYYGMDMYGGVVSFVSTSGVSAFDPTSGASRWTWTPPSGDGVCAAAASGGIILVAYAYRALTPNDLCSAVAAINEADGSVLWSRAEPGAQTLFYLAAGEGQALVEVQFDTGGAPMGEIDDYDLATGAPGWTDSLDSELDSGCLPTQPLISGGAIRMFDACPNQSEFTEGSAGLYSFDLSTGRQLSDFRLSPLTCGSGGILAPGPGDVVAGCSGLLGFGLRSLAFLDPATGAQHTAQVDTDYFTRTVVYGDTAYLTLETPENSTRADDEAVVAAFDLSSGHELWQHPVAGYQATVIKADASGVLAAVYNGATLSLVRYAPADGTETLGPGLALDAPSEVLSALARNGALDVQLYGDVLMVGGARNASSDFQTQTDPGLVGLRVSQAGGF